MLSPSAGKRTCCAKSKFAVCALNLQVSDGYCTTDSATGHAAAVSSGNSQGPIDGDRAIKGRRTVCFALCSFIDQFACRDVSRLGVAFDKVATSSRMYIASDSLL